MSDRRTGDLDDFFSDIAKRTERIEAPVALADRVMATLEAAREDTVDEELARLGERTRDLEPSTELTARVMKAIRASGGGWSENLARTGLRAMAVAAAVAAACILFSTYAERSLDTRLISTMDSVEGGE